MAPPFYSELSRSAKDLFNCGYNFDTFTLDLKTKTPSGVEFVTSGVSYFSSGKVLGTLETKYKFKDCGVTFSEKWNTSNILATEISLKDVFIGTKFSAESTFAPQTGDKSLKLKTEFKNKVLAVNGDANFKTAIPIIHLAGVFGYRGYFSGCQLKYDCKDSKLKNYNLALSYATKEFTLHTNVDDGKHFHGHIYQKVNQFLATGVELGWSSDNNDTKFGLACCYELDRNTSVRAKFNNSNQIGLGFSQKLRPGISITLSMLIERKNFNQGRHKLGFGLEFDV